jgi:hypothetical protein
MEFTTVAIDMDSDGCHELALEFFQGDAQFGNRVPVDIAVEKHVPPGNLDDGERKFWLH